MSNKTFTATGKMTDIKVDSLTEATVLLGLVDENGADVSVDFNSGFILICMKAEDDKGYVVLKKILTLDSKDDRASRFVIPANQSITVIFVGAGANLYAEIKTGLDRN